MAGDARPRESA
uniref:Uncharacterized protein n=1 Tax=Arundo donax TaxID=35708 RepID=A0A0A8Y123_ARUDO